jgi:hypothetical protein
VKIQTCSALKSWDRVGKVNLGREKHDAHSGFNWRDSYGRVASCDVAGVDPMVSRKELVDISGQGLCRGWKARNARKRSWRSPKARTACGPTLRGWHDLLNIRPKRSELILRREFPASSTKRTLLGGLRPLGPASSIADANGSKPPEPVPPVHWVCA